VAVSGMMTRLKQQQAVFAYSTSGNTGKSSFIDLLAGLVPDHARSHVSLHVLLTNEFGLPNLVGKLLNMRSEMPKSRELREEAFNEIITGDPMEANPKGRARFSFTPTAMHIFAGNDLPNIVGGIGSGAKRRFYGMPFGASIEKGIPVAEQYDGKIGKDIAANEAGVVLAWALPVLSRVVKEGRLPQTAETEAALAEWLRDADAIECFVADCIGKAAGGFVEWALLWDEFGKWWIGQGYSATKPPRKQFEARVRAPLEALGANVHARRQSGGRRTRGVTGVALGRGEAS